MRLLERILGSSSVLIHMTHNSLKIARLVRPGLIGLSASMHKSHDFFPHQKFVQSWPRPMISAVCEKVIARNKSMNHHCRMPF